MNSHLVLSQLCFINIAFEYIKISKLTFWKMPFLTSGTQTCTNLKNKQYTTRNSIFQNTLIDPCLNMGINFKKAKIITQLCLCVTIPLQTFTCLFLVGISKLLLQPFQETLYHDIQGSLSLLVGYSSCGCLCNAGS